MSDPTTTPEILELIMRTSRVKGFRDLYSLAPRGHRVGIYFQQRRATLLAAALRSRLGRERLRNCSVGIVGGGASGITFLLALKNEGAENVRLYEAAGQLITRGMHARHRLLHPNYNRWPLLGSMDVFTNLPMMNWYATSADKVAAQMTSEIGALHRNLIDDQVEFGCKVDRITQHSLELKNPLRISLTKSGAHINKDHGLVVIAAGYGDERATTWGLNDYWSLDPADFDSGKHLRRCTVYGAGDGALIDIIRSCALDPSEAWLLPLGTISRLRPTGATTIEKDGLREIPLKPPTFTDFEKAIQAHEESIRSIAWPLSRDDEDISSAYALEEKLFYENCVKQLSESRKSVVAYLEGLLKPRATSGLRPVLVSSMSNGFEPTSAPINKLLLAYLLSTGRVEYSRRSRTMIHDELDRWNGTPASARAKEITICRFGASRNFPLTSGPPSADGISVEVEGSSVPLHETPMEAHLIDALSGISGGEYVYFDAMPDPGARARHGLDNHGVAQETRHDNRPVIEGFAREHLGATSVQLVARTSECGPKWVILTDMDDAAISAKLRSLGGLDGNFLGAPIVVSNPAHPGTGDF